MSAINGQLLVLQLVFEALWIAGQDLSHVGFGHLQAFAGSKRMSALPLPKADISVVNSNVR